MAKRVVRLFLSSLLLLVLSAHLSAFTFASRPSKLTRQFPKLSTSRFDRENPAIQISSQKYDSLLTLRSGSDGSIESKEPSVLSKILAKANKNFFLVGMFITVIIAKISPAVSMIKDTIFETKLLPHVIFSRFISLIARCERWHRATRAVHWKVRGWTDISLIWSLLASFRIDESSLKLQT